MVASGLARVTELAVPASMLVVAAAAIAALVVPDRSRIRNF